MAVYNGIRGIDALLTVFYDERRSAKTKFYHDDPKINLTLQNLPKGDDQSEIKNSSIPVHSIRQC